MVVKIPDTPKDPATPVISEKSSHSGAPSPSLNSKPAGNFLIKIHLYSTLEVKQTTTVNFPGDMLCKKSSDSSERSIGKLLRKEKN